MNDLPLELINYLSDTPIDSFERITIKQSLARTCKKYYGLFSPSLATLKMISFESLLTATVNNNITEIKSILNRFPELLLMISSTKLIVISETSGLKCYATHPIEIALNFKLVDCLEVFINYYKKLELENLDIKTLFKQWKAVEIKRVQALVTTNENYFASLIAVFSKEKFPNGDNLTQLSEHTEKHIKHLLNILVPHHPVESNHHRCIELFLASAHLNYCKYAEWLNPRQKAAFYLRVIGLIQSVLPIPSKQILCASVYLLAQCYDIDRNLSEKAKSFFIEQLSAITANHTKKTGVGYTHVYHEGYVLYTDTLLNYFDHLYECSFSANTNWMVLYSKREKVIENIINPYRQEVPFNIKPALQP